MNDEGTHEGRHGRMYRRLLAMTAISFVVMYGLMFAMVDVWPNVVHNVNTFYMAGLMATSMIIIELVVMRQMYQDKGRSLIFYVVGTLLLVGFWYAIRAQLAVGDKQFLRSMIPHHSGAILMCNEASIQDPEVKELCRGIVESQEAEIAQMKAILQRMEDRR